jgi:hypothetical protein
MDAPRDILLPYQRRDVDEMKRILRTRDCVLNGGDTGIGKTYEMCQLAVELGMPIFGVVPKATIDNWFEVATLTGANVLGITNYESAKNGKYYRLCDEYIAESRTVCEYITKAVDPDTGATVYRWTLPPGTLLIFDEAHRGKNASTKTSKLMEFANGQPGCKIAILSATITDSVLCFKTPAFMLGLAQRGRHAYNAWLRSIRAGKRSDAEALHHIVYVNLATKCGVRTRIRDLQNDQDAIVRQIFRGNTIVAQVFEVSPEVEAEIEAGYAAIADAIASIKNKQRGEQCALTLILRARQRIELLRVPNFVMLAMEHIDRGRSVIIFVHFNDTMTKLFEQLDPFIQAERGSFIATIHGGQTPEDRKHDILAFREDRARIIIANVNAGGVGISLNDVNGRFPRTALHPPSWSSIALKQSLGRAHRAGSRSDTIQIIVYCRGHVSVAPVAINPAAVAMVQGLPPNHPAARAQIAQALGNDTTFNSSEGKGKVGVEELMAEHVNRKLTTLEWFNNGDDEDLVLL